MSRCCCLLNRWCFPLSSSTQGFPAGVYWS